tara:strand:- start:6437 stop:7720 length:1284 start_codon:yes stop_codon:yes gene_type:complete
VDNYLRKAVEVKFGKPITRQRDINELKEEVFIETSNEIGFNTLRRGFGFLPSVKCSRKTLNILSNYIGFRSYNHFLSRDTENRLSDDWIELQMQLSQKKVKRGGFTFLENYLDKDYFSIFISHVIKSLIDQENWKQLSFLFEENSLFIHNHRTVVARMATSLHFSLITLSEKKLNKVSVLLENKNFRDLAIYMWVDYDHANGYFGSLIRSSIQHLAVAEEKLFSQLYLRKVAFLNLAEFNIDYENIEFPENCHPVLHGRYLSMLYLDEPKKRKTTKKEILSTASSHKAKNEFFQELIPILMLLKDFSFLEEIFNLYYDELVGYVHWDHISIERYNIIALVLLNIKNGLVKNNKLLFEFFAQDQVFHNNDQYHKIFYCIARYHHKKLSGDEDSIIEIEKNYSKLGKEMKFPFFNLSFLKNYFSEAEMT